MLRSSSHQTGSPDRFVLNPLTSGDTPCLRPAPYLPRSKFKKAASDPAQIRWPLVGYPVSADRFRRPTNGRLQSALCCRLAAGLDRFPAVDLDLDLLRLRFRALLQLNA